MVGATSAVGSGRIDPTPDGFVEKDGTESPEEDFANNVEYFLFDRKTLIKKTPTAEDWIHRKFGDKFKLGKVPK